jgi:phosphatidylethanolamine/phosphatidyl-N-methylethanolamine N-methyltransferase
VVATYARLAPIYDLAYGLALRPGRRKAIERLAPRRGDLVLEVGTGTGLSALSYPPGCRVVAIDISPHMLARARDRLARRDVNHVALCRMDAMDLALPDRSVDGVYAPYVVNVVPDPVRAVREMARVCRPGGRIVLLNHFSPIGRRQGWVHRVLGRAAGLAGAARWNLELRELLDHAGLVPSSVDAVNAAGVSAVVLCRKPTSAHT